MATIFGIDIAYIRPFNLLKTKTMKGLQEIAEHDSEWRKIALRITNNKDHADDIVQSMYLKLSDKEEDVNDYYIAMTLKSIFIDDYRKHNTKINYTSQFDHLNEVADKSYKYEPNDDEQELLDRIDSLTYVQRELLEEAYDRSLRDIGKRHNICHVYAYRQIKKAVDEVLGDEAHLYENSSLKYLKK